MVFFTCNNCGESIKKPSIAKHYMTKCRGSPNVTCVDCFKDFRGAEYEAHIKCVTEDERYAAKGFVAKPNSNKGERKQQTWFESVQNLLSSNSNLKQDERELLELLSNHENLPRKKSKFLNFLNSAYRAYAKRQELVERVWNLIEEVGKAATAPTTPQPKENGTKTEDSPAEEPATNGTPEKKQKKRKGEAETNGNGETPSKKQKSAEDEGDSIPEKKKKKKAAATEETEENGVSEKQEPIPDKKKKAENGVEMNGESGGVLQRLLSEGGEDGSMSWYKLSQALEKHCATEAGVEKASKMLKKLQKKIVVRLEKGKIVIDDAA